MTASRRLRSLLLVAAAALVGAAGAQGPVAGTLRVAFPVAENGFDPQAVYDAYSARVCNAIFDPLYTYDYFARPARLIPNTADGLPLIGDGGRTYTIKLRRGIHFAPHPAFGNAKRELTAEDYLYSIKRILDPQVRSYPLYLLENRLVGLDPVLAEARRTGRLDYAAPIEGLKALDRYTLQVKFREPNWSFQHLLTTTAFAAVAREVVAAKGDSTGRVMEDPWEPGPTGSRSGGAASASSSSQTPRSATALSGPAAREHGGCRGREGSHGPQAPAVAAGRDRDHRGGPAAAAGLPPRRARLRRRAFVARRDGARRREPEARSREGRRAPAPPGRSIARLHVLQHGRSGRRRLHPGEDRVAARDHDGQRRREYVRVLANGQAEPATQMIPPPVPGHSPALAIKEPFDPAAARALLDRFGYRDRDGDGFREMSDGKPLLLRKGATPVAADRAASELWTRNLAAIGLRTEFLVQKWPELNKMAEAGQLQIWNLAWITSVPDADTFYSALYSRNIGLSNDARLKLAEYDQAYERMRALPEGPERQATYRRMNELVVAYAPWILETYSYQNRLAQPWLRGLRLHPFLQAPWIYYGVDH